MARSGPQPLEQEGAMQELGKAEYDADIDSSFSAHPSVVDRYFTRTYKPGVGRSKEEDHCILVHSNRICIVTLAEGHPILKDNKVVTKVNFEVDKKTNRQENKVSGKYKRGAQKLQQGSVLCHVTCDDVTYTVCSCVRGGLMEVNEKLIQQPQLLSSKPQGEGYIAIVLTRLQDHEEQISKLLSQEQYNELLQTRKKETETGKDDT